MTYVETRMNVWEALAGRAPGEPGGPADPGLWGAVVDRLNPTSARPVLRAGIEAVQAHLPEGHTTVGFEVNVTPKGKKVTVRAELVEVDGRKLRFKVEAHDEDKKVGEGTHRRAIIAVQPKA